MQGAQAKRGDNDRSNNSPAPPTHEPLKGLMVSLSNHEAERVEGQMRCPRGLPHPRCHAGPEPAPILRCQLRQSGRPTHHSAPTTPSKASW